VVLGLILLVQIARGETFEPQASESAEASAQGSVPALLWAAAAVLVPLFSMRPLGFPLTAMLAFALVTRAFGSRRLVFDCLLGLVLGTVCWFGFTRLGVSLGSILPLAGA
jgi:putative tricarboxylic transport membrane protein